MASISRVNLPSSMRDLCRDIATKAQTSKGSNQAEHILRQCYQINQDHWDKNEFNNLIESHMWTLCEGADTDPQKRQQISRIGKILEANNLGTTITRLLMIGAKYLNHDSNAEKVYQNIGKTERDMIGNQCEFLMSPQFYAPYKGNQQKGVLAIVSAVNDLEFRTRHDLKSEEKTDE